ncbi:MAG: ATP-dependent helicase [Treponema sp.]|nr:ATP-dependent helicase [Treponema sp.]
MNEATIEQLWEIAGFTPNDNQREAILHTDGPLFLTAGPGSGKTRVLLWRTLNLIVFHGVQPEEIYLSTFTEKAARQLRDGLRTLLGRASNKTNQAYDISGMAIGTVHSICRRIITDNRFSEGGERSHAPKLLDELAQFFKIYKRAFWTQLYEAGGFEDEETATLTINAFFNNMTKDGPKRSRLTAVKEVIGLFNRFSEECFDPSGCETKDEILNKLITMYEFYLTDLNSDPLIKTVDFSLLQIAAFNHISALDDSGTIFKHIIIDEYQDTNTIQEKIFFALAKGHTNICVVGDDDQALYRFRGATVENLVGFSERCETAIGVKPKRIDLSINYRSRKKIVDAYSSFIDLIDWRKEPPQKGFYRIADKNIRAHRSGEEPALLVTSHTKKEIVYREIAEFVYQLKISKKIEDYSQIAFLFPSVKTPRVQDYKKAFDELNEEKDLIGTPDELKIYAPRAGRFLEVEEAMALWGLMQIVFCGEDSEETEIRLSAAFIEWMELCRDLANRLCKEDKQLEQYIADRRAELALILKDYGILMQAAENNKLSFDDPFPQSMIRAFSDAPGLSARGKKNLSNKYFINSVKHKETEGKPYTVGYIISRGTSLDWTVLDLFHQLCGFSHFRKMFELAQNGLDEGPICNLALISDYLARFMEEYSTLISAPKFKDNSFYHNFFHSFTFALFRLDETEYENPDNPFPKGRISFLTIHQSKGLEFPVVVLGNLRRTERSDQKEIIIRSLLEKEGEPLDKIAKFDNMRMFYVAMSRAKNVLVLPRFTTTRSEHKTPYPDQLYSTDEFKSFLSSQEFPLIEKFDMACLPDAQLEKEDLGKTYSYTSDFFLYERCPRQYMIFKQYDFVPSRSQTMFFGSLIHRTIEDLHNILIKERKKDALL